MDLGLECLSRPGRRRRNVASTGLQTRRSCKGERAFLGDGMNALCLYLRAEEQGEEDQKQPALSGFIPITDDPRVRA